MGRGEEKTAIRNVYRHTYDGIVRDGSFTLEIAICLMHAEINMCIAMCCRSTLSETGTG
jgi:hypothetical protein